jgi:putative transposase
MSLWLVELVRRVLAKHYQPESGNDGRSWLTVIGHLKDSLWSVDLIRCESILLRSHWVMVVKTCSRDASSASVSSLLTSIAFPCAGCSTKPNQTWASHGISVPITTRRLPSPTQANLRVLDIDEIKSVHYVPLSHPFIEKLIGTIRREYLDHVLFWNQFDLQRKLEDFKVYYNQRRVHCSLNGNTPHEQGGHSPSKLADLRHFAWTSECNGLLQIPIAA